MSQHPGKCYDRLESFLLPIWAAHTTKNPFKSPKEIGKGSILPVGVGQGLESCRAQFSSRDGRTLSVGILLSSISSQVSRILFASLWTGEEFWGFFLACVFSFACFIKKASSYPFCWDKLALTRFLADHLSDGVVIPGLSLAWVKDSTFPPCPELGMHSFVRRRNLVLKSFSGWYVSWQWLARDVRAWEGWGKKKQLWPPRPESSNTDLCAFFIDSWGWVEISVSILLTEASNY